MERLPSQHLCQLLLVLCFVLLVSKQLVCLKLTSNHTPKISLKAESISPNICITSPAKLSIFCILDNSSSSPSLFPLIEFLQVENNVSLSSVNVKSKLGVFIICISPFY